MGELKHISGAEYRLFIRGMKARHSGVLLIETPSMPENPVGALVFTHAGAPLLASDPVLVRLLIALDQRNPDSDRLVDEIRAFITSSPRPAPRDATTLKLLERVRNRFAAVTVSSPLIIQFTSLEGFDNFSFLAARHLLDHADGIALLFVFHYELAAVAPAALQDPDDAGLTEMGRRLFSLLDLCVKIQMWNRAAIVLDELLRYLPRFRDEGLQGLVLFRAGMIYDRQGKLGTAVSSYERALVCLEHAGDSETLVKALNNVGNLYLGENQFTEADRCFARALALGEELQSDYHLAVTYGNYATVDLQRRDAVRALANLHKSLVFTARSGYFRHAQYTYGSFGDAWSMRGDDVRALAYYSKAQRVCVLEGNLVDGARLQLKIARFHVERKQVAQASAALQEAESVYRRLRNDFGLLGVEELSAELSHTMGDGAGAQRHLAEAQRLAQVLENKPAAARLVQLARRLRQPTAGSGAAS